MPEAVSQVAPIAPVIATGGEAAPARRQATPTSPMEGKLLEVMGQVNAKHGGDPNEFKSFGEITDNVEREAKGAPAQKPKPAAVPAKPTGLDKAAAGTEGKPVLEGTELDGDMGTKPKPPNQKEKLKVGDTEYELDGDQLKRFAQKGIFHEKRAIEVVKKEQAADAKATQADQIIQQHNAFIKALQENPGETLEQILGTEAFSKLKPWAVQKVQKEMHYEENPQQKAIDEANARAEAAETTLKQQKEQAEQAQISQAAQEYGTSTEKLIIDALKESGVPSEGVDFAAAEMAGHISRALARNIEYTPQQLANLVKEDNQVRVKWGVGVRANRILEAQKGNDMATVLKEGQALVEEFGEPLMYAIAKFHLAKIQGGQQNAGGQPNLPKPILEAPRPQEEAKKGWGKNGQQYMSEDDFRDIRQKIARGEMEPPPGW